MRQLVRFAAGAVTVVVGLGSAPTAEATTLTFDTLPSSLSGGILTGNPLVESGFQLSHAIPSGSGGFHAFADGWQSNRGSSNGTTTLAAFDFRSGSSVTFTLQAVGGSAFDLFSIDLAELLRPSDFAFAGVARNVTFTGTLAGGGTVTAGLAIDLISDGPGGAIDFQTLSFSSAWRNLASVTVVGTHSGSTFGTNLLIDNINLDLTTVPEPGTLWLLAIGGPAAVLLRFRRASARARRPECLSLGQDRSTADHH